MLTYPVYIVRCAGTDDYPYLQPHATEEAALADAGAHYPPTSSEVLAVQVVEQRSNVLGDFRLMWENGEFTEDQPLTHV